MIPEYRLYHGALLATLVSGTGIAIKIESPEASRPSEYIINDSIGLHVKHATQRLRPWHFGFTPENIRAIRSLGSRFEDSYLILVCKQDGLLAVDIKTVVNNISPSEGLWIRADREKRKHYRVFGPLGEFPRKYDSNALAVRQLIGIKQSL